ADAPTTPTEREAFDRLIEREAVLHRAALHVDLDDEPERAGPFVERARVPVIAGAVDPRPLRRPHLAVAVEPTPGAARAPRRLDELAQRIEPASTWDSLVLPSEARRLLDLIAAQLKHRDQVYGAWGFAPVGSRGAGIAALFAGPSGTGKTTAAEVLARELQL